MKNKKVLIVIIIVIGVLSFFLLRSKGNSPSSQQGTSSVKADKSGKKIAYYQSPMDPTYISEKPGKDTMGMDMVPVYEGEEPVAGGVRIDPATVQNIGVRSEVITKRILERNIRAVGRVTYDEKKVAYINTKIGGWIEKLYVDYEGQEVKQDDPLLEIYSAELVSTQQEYLLALEYNKKMQESNIEEISNRSQTLVNSARKRLEYWDVPQKHIKELEQTGEVKKTLMIHSPATGVITHKTALEGQYIKPGENLYRIADLSTIWVYADIYEYELPWIKSGQTTEMTLSYLPGKVFTGKITYVYPYLEKKTRTIKVRLEFDNPTGELKPDMYTEVKINTAPSTSVVAVPKESIIHSGRRKVLIIDKGEGLFEPRDVLIGMETKGFYEILHGAKEGEKVVTSAQFLIDSESQLTEAISKMLKAKKEEGKKMKMDMPEGTAMSVKVGTQKAMDDIWDVYFQIRKQLSQDSLANMKQQALLIKNRANAIIQSKENQNMKLIAEKIMDTTKELSEKDIVKVREAFLVLSDSMIQYMKNYAKKESKEKGYQLFYCGMEKKPWVQQEEKVGNPYVSAKIAFCGARDSY
ncbi:Probable Co/Zn/Cd efflux system membrane fusion protein [hydrothermal vent metagenome]|uniref:Probable Co/Zn/Cd efflux system membrane fusion protein n=1 Tax=hydrothermal vent metagenome TaxID=652676 RepID=A0A3B1DLT3_9ZZZZ